MIPYSEGLLSWEKEELALAYPKGERIFTDGSKTDEGTGSAYYDEKTDFDAHVKTHGK